MLSSSAGALLDGGSPRLRGRLAESGGYTLTEMIVVLAILGIFLGALTQLFVSGSKAEADMSNRYRAQQNARLALDGLRREIHCARAITGTPTTSSITFTLDKYCPSNTTGAIASYTWCTHGAAAPYTLWRSSGDAAACAGTTGRQWVGDLTTSAVFTYPVPAGGNLGTVSVDLPVDLTPGDTRQRYELKDDIVLRNTTRLP